ncbi:ECF RNA polymerase sigma factor SigE [Gemmata obscuriglobus]|nr:sigma-70 family RNA polymerase sigma factor [Gemmata obscuriglobus]QEG31726.1 ECF RNA polymerase sigma factor SigE [Gemmata obscuriglobus]VTS11072.1 sigma-70 family rna polymerase sigma factor : RNA polymerase sigma factor, sigma-70 family OS=Singulisphaera acidiphila (strain ATCC BAA-1392 / DSM 18658 / VKM B-2454 / MOB10) GN=Sinac_7487 PE=4 SV=1: Sigma70_r2: Sigma70_r4_2 [Gemmata obscuriglobus UQM 2246]
MRSLIHRVRSRLQPGADEASDECLLTEFLTSRADDAFAAIVRRHGPMVTGVCRRALGNSADADDAFQAVWLVLLRKADAVRPRSRLGNFLHGVAVNVARRSRDARARRGTQSLTVEVPEREAASGDLREALDAALSELPAVYRAAVIACDLEGHTRTEAAGRLGWSEGTVASRLARGRAILADRLTRRGLALPAAGLVTALGSDAGASASGPTVAARLRHPSPAAERLAAEVVRATFANKLRGAAVQLFAMIGVTSVGAAAVWAWNEYEQPTPEVATDRPAEARAPQTPDAGAVRKPSRFVLRNPARDITVVTDRPETVPEFFRRQPVLVARVKSELWRQMLEGKSDDAFHFVDSASFNADGPRVAAYGASVKLAPVATDNQPLLDVLSASSGDESRIFVRDATDKNLWHVVGTTQRTSAGFFASKDRVQPDEFAPADLIQPAVNK